MTTDRGRQRGERHPHHHPEHPGMEEFGPPWRGRRGGRRRAMRGNVRAAVLLLLAQEPMHGYQLMQAISDRSGGQWAPSPGAIYPTINQLEDEGLVTVTADAGRKLVTLTEAGRRYVADHGDDPDPFAAFAGGDGSNRRMLVLQLHGAVREVARNGTDAQRHAAADILNNARRSLYLLLAGDDATSTT